MNRFDVLKRKSVMVLSVLTVLIVAFIWSNSFVSGEESGARSGSVTKFLLSILDPNGRIPEDSFHHFIRKTAHFVEFAVLGVVLGSLFRVVGQETGRSFFSLPVLLVLLVAVIDEYIQFFTGRGSMVTDVVLDFAGGLTGLLLAFLLSLLKKKK